MKIPSRHIGEYIAKLLAIKPTVEIYEVEEWGFCSINICARDSYVTCFTTLKEAKQHFDKVAELNKFSGENTTIMKDVCPTISYRKEGVTLRKTTASLVGCKTEVLATNIAEQLIYS